MLWIEEIKSVIKKLPKSEFIHFRNRSLEKEWREWDKEISEDSEKGLLDFLIEEALEEKREGKLKIL